MNQAGFSNPAFNLNSSTFQDPRQQMSAQMTQQKQHGNFLTHLLPTIGSIVGGVGGTFIAPVAGTAVGGAAGGALGTLLENKLEGNSATDNLALNTGLGALGGVGKLAKGAYGATQALRAGEGAAVAGNILRFGAKGAATIGAEGTPGMVNQAITATNANNGTGLLGKMAQGADKFGQQAMVSQAGSVSTGTAANAARDITGLRNLGYNSFDAAAQHAPAITGPDGALTVARGQIVRSPQASQVDASNFMGMVKDHLNNGVSLTDSEKKNILNVAQNTFDKNQLAGQSAPGITSAENLQNALKDIGKIKTTTPAAKSTVNNIYGDLRSTLSDATANVPVDNTMKSQITSQLKLSGVNNPNVMKAVNQATTWGDLAQIESKFVTAGKVAQESQVNALKGGVPGLIQGGKPTLTGMLNQAAGGLAEKGVSAGGNILGKMAKTPVTITSPSQLLTQTAKSVGKAQALPAISRLSAPTQTNNPQNLLSGPQTGTDATASLLGQTNGSNDATAALLGQPQQSTQQGGPSLQSLQQAIQQDIAATGGKNTSNLMQLGQLYGIVDAQGQPTNGQQKLSSTQQTNMDGLNQAAATLGTYYQQLQQAGGGQGLAQAPIQSLLGKVGLGGDKAQQIRALEQTRVDVATTLAKAMTGNGRPAQSQIDQWMQSIPNATDPQGVAQQKLQNILGLIQARTQVYQNPSNLLTQLNGAQ